MEEDFEVKIAKIQLRRKYGDKDDFRSLEFVVNNFYELLTRLFCDFSCIFRSIPHIKRDLVFV